MATRKEEIIPKAIEILESNPDGVRYSDLVKKRKYMQNSQISPLIVFTEQSGI